MVFVQVFGLAIALLWQSPNGIVSLLWRGVSVITRTIVSLPWGGVSVITRYYYLLLRSE